MANLLYKNIYNNVYDQICGVNTPSFYKKVLLDFVKDNTSILEVGIGNGICLDKNAQLIKNKNLSIFGIDIDADYLEQCAEIIKKNNLQNNVKIKNQDLLCMKSKIKYDYVIFSESYPVIPDEIMKKMMKKCKQLLKRKGQIIFIHNLVDEKDFLRDFLKPKLKNLIMIDFGKLTTHKEFDDFIADVNFKIKKKILIENVRINETFGIKILPECINNKYIMEQYCICVLPKPSVPVERGFTKCCTSG
jgi:ubiquinone/menaquinone biosynthesis C-methylase UbiE